MDCLEPINQDKHMAVDFSTRRAVMTPWVTVAVCIVIVVLTLGATAAVVWTSTPQVSMPTVQDAAVTGLIPETIKTPVEMRGSPGQETNPQVQAGPSIMLVTGLVVNPGVVEVPASMRAAEAVNRAGGLLPRTNLASVNLVASLADDQQIVVGTEALPAGTAEGGADTSGSSGVGATGIAGPDGSDGKINISIASATQLEGLSRIGPATVIKIIDFREKNGASASIDALEEAPGIGPAKVEALRDTVTV